jgi:Yip1 domain
MDEPLPALESPPQASPPAMSLAARLLNVFAIPGEVFAGVKAGRSSIGNWLVPALLSAVVGTLAAIAILSQPVIQQQMREQQAKLMAKQVQAGTLTSAQADQMLALVEKLMVPIAVIVTVVASVVRVLWWALVLRLLGQMFLKVRLGYSKMLEVAGLGTMISVLGAIVTLLLTVKFGTFETPGLRFVVDDFEAARKSQLALGAATAFSFWLAGVMSVGLARLGDVPFLRAAWLVFAYWVLQETLLGSLF